MSLSWSSQIGNGVAALSKKEAEVRSFLTSLRERSMRIDKSDKNEGNIVVSPSRLLTHTDRELITQNKKLILAILQLEEAVDEALFEPSGYVYFLRSGSFVKIGKTKDVDERIKTLRIQLPFEVEVLNTIQCKDHHALESILHEIFADSRANGEWFRMENVEDSLGPWLKMERYV